jgi:two-component system response regulator NreC
VSVEVIRVVIADDHAQVRAGLRATLEGASDISVVGEAANGREAVEMAERLRPAVVIMDLAMPEMDGAEATREITRRNLGSRVLVLTMRVEDDFVVPLLDAGAWGYVTKMNADRELVGAVRVLAHGGFYVKPDLARAMIRRHNEAGRR